MDRMSEGVSNLATVSGVEVFAAGVRRGNPYTIADLDDMVRNFKANYGLVQPPVVAGHEEEQTLNNTGYPAFGRVVRLWRSGPILMADFDRVPPFIARLINARAYSRVSAEIYESPPEGVPGKGKMLRRVALLGGDLPQIKDLKELPQAEYSEQRPARVAKLKVVTGKPVGRGAHRLHVVFSEVTPMDRDEMMTKLGEAGMDQSVASTMTDSQMAEVLRCMDTKNMDEGEEAGGGEPDRDDLIRQLTDLGQDPAELASMDDAGLRALLASIHSGKTSSDSANAEGEDDADKTKDMGDEEGQEKKPDTYRERGSTVKTATKTKPVVRSHSERAAALEMAIKASEARLARLEAETTKRLNEERRARIVAFCEANVKAGKILPAEIDAGLVETAMSLEHQKVQKFGEESRTPLEQWMKTIEARPVLVSFAERVKASQGGAAGGNGDAEVAEVQRFAEVQADALAKVGTTPAVFVESFKTARKHQPNMTAKQFIGA